MRLFRRTLLITFTVLPLIVSLQARADDPTQGYLELLKEVEQNRTLFNMAVTSCLDEVYAEKSERANDSGALEKCIAGKGVQLSKESAGPAVHHMGRGNNEASVLTYQIPQKEALLQRLQGRSPEPLVAAPAPASRMLENPAAAPAAPQPQSTQAEANSQKGGSSQPKYYLPSKESGEKSKPIFLNR